MSTHEHTANEQIAGTDGDTIISLIDHANDLKQLPRMGWLLAGVAQAESVAEHSYVVTLLTMLLAEAVNADWQAEDLSQPIDIGRALRLALLHDLAESILTDLPKQSSDLIGATVKHEVEAKAMAGVLQGVPNGEDYLQLWHEYDVAASPEARLVKDADKLEMVHQAWRYQQRGHTNLDEFWQGHEWYYAASRAFYRKLQER